MVTWVTVIVMATAVRDISNAVTTIVWLVVQSLNKKLTTKLNTFANFKIWAWQFELKV